MKPRYDHPMVVAAPALPVVETARLRLRCAEPRDAEALAALMSEAVSRRLASWPVPYTPPMALDRIAGVRMAAAERRSLPLVIERRADGVVAGWISVSRAPGDGATALITYWLGEGFHGQGLMREAAPVALAEAFRTMDVARVRAAVQADNAPSLAVVRLLGMAPMGPGRIWCPARGRDEPCLWFEIARADAAAARDAAPVGATTG
jgi:RimJ/RimL family protein N-acetyltransferase